MIIKIKNVLFFLFLVLIFCVVVIFLLKENNDSQESSNQYAKGYPSKPECLKIAEAAIARHGKGYPESGVTGNPSREFWVGKYRFDLSSEPRYFETIAEGQYYIGTNGVRAPLPGQDVLTRIPIGLLMQRYKDKFKSMPSNGTYLQIGFVCELDQIINKKWASQSAIEKEQEQRSKDRVPELKEIEVNNGLRVFISSVNKPYVKNEKYYYPIEDVRQYDGRLLSFTCYHGDICHGDFYLADNLRITYAFPYENLSDWDGFYNFVTNYSLRGMGK